MHIKPFPDIAPTGQAKHPRREVLAPERKFGETLHNLPLT
jgi:hypothetical protein